MRAWGLAQGLNANGIDVTIAINAGFPQKLSEYEDIKLTNWDLNAEFAKFINTFDTIIISYCMGDPSVFVADHIADSVQLVLDCYVPIYIEVSARESKNISEEYVNYAADIARHNHVLRRGDYFLYANDAQEQLYKGVLAALGVINPKSYRDVRLVKAPFGIHRKDASAENNPYEKLGIGKDDFIVLWFGGIYPWFRIQEYLDTIEKLSKEKNIRFVFVGGKNPFNPNPDFSRQYDNAVTFSDKHHFTDTLVHFVDWVDFDARINWFKHADVIVSLNQPGEENKYSWRTRVMDFVWGESVIITNGGDPLSNELIEKNAALQISELTSGALVSAINNLRANRNTLSKMRSNVLAIKDNYYWDVVTKEISDLIVKGSLPFSQELTLRKQATLDEETKSAMAALGIRKMSKIVRLPLKLARKVRQKGVMRSAKVARDILRVQLKSRIAGSGHQKQFIFISHPINNSGAPLVLLQIIEEYVEKYGAERVRVFAPGIEPNQKDYLKKLGVSVEQAIFGANFHMIRAQLNLKPDDFVLINTVAVYDAYRNFILRCLEKNQLNHAFWFIHEDIAQLPVVNAELLGKHFKEQFKRLVDQQKLTIMLPSRKVVADYRKLFNISAGKTINLRVEVPAAYKGKRAASDYQKVKFLLSGYSSDGRKGQLLALSAFQYYRENYASNDSGRYRPFELHLVAVTDQDYVSRQVRWISETAFNGEIHVYNALSKDDALKITYACNAVVCASLNETFGLYIAEGMLMGHVVLRNNCAGVDEQLVDGENGYLFDHTDIVNFAGAIAKILDKENLSDEDLKKMGERSQAIMKSYANHRYIDQINQIGKE